MTYTVNPQTSLALNYDRLGLRVQFEDALATFDNDTVHDSHGICRLAYSQVSTV